MAPIVITQANAPPPNYEEATKISNFKPPEYRTVVEDNSSLNESNSSPPEQTNQIQTQTTNNQQTELKTSV